MPIETINDGNALNSAGGTSISNRSKFVNKYPFANTVRFGEYSPIFCAETVSDDRHMIHLGHNIISNTLKSPLLQDVILKKDLFWVPDMCILPLNWEKFFVNPVKGEDVPNDVGCGVEHFGNIFSSFISNIVGSLTEYDLTDSYANKEEYVEMLLKFALLMDMICSDGALSACLQMNLHCFLDTVSLQNWGNNFDKFITGLLNLTDEDGIEFKLGTNYYTLLKSSSSEDIRTVLSVLRDDFSFTVSEIDCDIEDLSGIADDILSFNFSEFGDFPLNLRRLWAYQIVCSHYFTNDKIDYVFSAELYRQLVFNCIKDLASIAGEEAADFFEVNGLSYQYDYLSAHNFEKVLSYFYDNPHPEDLYQLFSDYVSGFQYLRLLFGYNNSLRYSDYFTGSRSQPLAVGDVTVSVNANKVNVVDIAARTMAAKMFNVANRIGQRIKSYVKEFFHIEMADDYHDPFWLAHTEDQIDNPENQNTGDAQYDKPNSITSIFRTGGNSTGFETTTDRAGVLIAVCYFDIQRVYPRPIHRNCFHIDRFDDFVPYLQFVGDQVVYQKEIDTNHYFSNTFAYQGRNMEYKQQIPFCAGAFRNDLAPYIFLANEAREKLYTYGSPALRIGPSFIRSIPSELDRFYTLLNGFSNETYYHFAIVNNIFWEATRPMAATPGILNG